MTVLAIIAPTTARNIILIAAGLAYLAYHVMRWWWKAEAKGRQEGEESEESDSASRQPPPSPPVPVPAPEPISAAAVRLSETAPQPSDPAGEELFRRARAMMHQKIPDYRIDGLYLDLLGEAADKGYAPAMAKLGEYAMRRAAWVEAYYWMSRARRRGMRNLGSVMCEIRRQWSLDGFPDEAEEITPIFSAEAGSIGRALLHVDSGHEAATAREFLRTHHPEFL